MSCFIFFCPLAFVHNGSTNTSQNGLVLAFESGLPVIAHNLGTEPNDLGVGNTKDLKEGKGLRELAASPRGRRSCFQGSKASSPSHCALDTWRESHPQEA